MGELADSFAGKVDGELIRATDWNGLIAAIEAQIEALGARLDARIEEVAGSIADLAARADALEGRIAPLEGLAGALRARLRRVDLEVTRATFAIGERGTIIARVTDVEGRPLQLGGAAERPWVDFVTVWGSLKAAPGFTSRGGASDRTISVRVDDSGEARVLIRAEPGEALAEEQEREVEAVLATAVGGRSVAETILAEPTPDSTQVRTAFQAVTRAYERTDTRVMQSFLDTYYIRRPPYVAGPIQAINWRDHHATVLAFVKPDDNPTTADGAQAAASIRVTFRDWVYPWIVVDYAPPPVVVVDDYRGRFGSLVRTGYAEAIAGVFGLVEERTANVGLIGKHRQFAAAKQAIAGLAVDDPPDYFDDLVKTAAGGLGLQQGLLFGQAAAPVPELGIEAGLAVGTAGARGEKAAERSAAETRAETRRQIDAAEARLGETVIAETQSLGGRVSEARQLAESASSQLQDVSAQLQGKAGLEVVRQLLTVRGGG